MAASLVQTSGKLQQDGVSGVQNFNMPGNFSAGNTAILTMVVYGSEPSNVTINGATATKASSSTDSGDGAYIYYVEGLSGGSSAFSVTVGSGQYITLACQEWSGLDSSALDATGNTASFSATPSVSTSGSTAQADEVRFAVLMDVSGSSDLAISCTSGDSEIWLENDSNSHQGGQAVYKTLSATGTQTASWSWVGARSYESAIATFKVAAGGGGGVSGSASITLGGATASGAGSLAIAGAASSTLGAVSLSSAAALAIGGAASATLGGVSSSSTGALSIAGALSASLGVVTLSAAGGAINGGALAATLGAVTPSSSGQLSISGASSAAIGAVSLVASGALSIAGAASQTLGGVTLSGASALGVSGALSAGLGAVSLSATGADSTAPITGALGATLGGVSLSASGEGPRRRRAASGYTPQRRRYLIDGVLYELTPYELNQLLLALHGQAKRKDVKIPAKRGRPAKTVPLDLWGDLMASADRMGALMAPESISASAHDETDDEDAIALLL